MHSADNDQGSSGCAPHADGRRKPSPNTGSAVSFWIFTAYVAAILLIVLFIAAIAGGYLP